MITCSSLIPIELDAQLLHRNFLRFGSRVGDHAGTDAVLDCLRHVAALHEVFEIEVQTRELVNKSELVKCNW